MMDVVIPVADEATNRTLPIALETIRKHAPQLRIVLVGDVWPWADQADLTIPMTQVASRALLNTDRAMVRACESSNVSDPFLWSNDDIYWRRPVTLAELLRQSETAWGQLKEHSRRGYYGATAWRTADLLASRGLPTWSYERHVPIVVRKAPMLAVLQSVELGQFAKRSLYLNTQLAQPSDTRQQLAGIRRDVKVFRVDDPPPADSEPFLSTGNNYPIERVRSLLGLE